MKNKLLYIVIALMIIIGLSAFIMSQKVRENQIFNQAALDDVNPDVFDPSGLELDENTDSDAEIDRELEALEKELDALSPNDFSDPDL